MLLDLLVVVGGEGGPPAEPVPARLRPLLADEARGKATYPAVMGLSAAKEEARAMMDEALGALDRFGVEADPLREIAQYIVKRKS